MARIRQLHQQLRKKAVIRADLRTAFVTDPNEGSLRDVLKRKEFQGIPFARAKRWADTEDWPKLRTEYIEKWQKDVVKRMGSIQTQRHIEQLKRIENMRIIALAALTGADAPAPKSLEGLLAAMLKLEEAEKHLGDEIENRLMGVATSTTKAQLPGALADDNAFDEAQKLLASKFNISFEDKNGPEPKTNESETIIAEVVSNPEQDGSVVVGNTTTVIYNANPSAHKPN